MSRIEAYKYWQELRSASKSQNKINGYGYSVNSMHDQDGIITELFRKITPNQLHTFIEFGCGDGMQNNTIYQLTCHNWRGLWIDGDAYQVEGVQKRMQYYRNGDYLDLAHALIGRDNVNSILGDYVKERKIPDLDLLVIDVDWNDYWIWKALAINPKVVCIEYNSHIPPDTSIVVPYNDELNFSPWGGSNWFGASLLALNELAIDKGYSLIGCSLAGSDAFFVRDDIVKSYFPAVNCGQIGHRKGDVAYLYEPARFELCFNLGHESHPWSNEKLVKLAREETIAKREKETCHSNKGPTI